VDAVTQTPKFEIGQLVYKWTGDYGGPGRVRGITVLPDGKLRYLVGHRIEGGKGEFLHVYAAGNLRESNDDDALDPVADLEEALTTETTELLDALATAHRQVDMLMAMVIGLDNSFMPSKTSLWPDIVKRVELMQKHGGSP
jgi:hypothetical protein